MKFNTYSFQKEIFRNVKKTSLTILLCLLLTASNAFGQWYQMGSNFNGEAGSQLGNSLSLSDDGFTIAIGAKLGSANGIASGEVGIYSFDISGNWTLKGEVIGGAVIGDVAGTSVDLNANGTIVAIGSIHNDDSGTSAGHVRVFEFTGDTWNQLGQPMVGENQSDNFGNSVSISDDGLTVAIGSRINAGGGVESGHARVFQYDGSDWIQMGQDIDGESPYDFAGFVSLNATGDILAVGAAGSDANGEDSGQVRVYAFAGSNWIQIGSSINGENQGNYTGQAISLNNEGNIIAIGGLSNEIGFFQGHVRVFALDGTEWTQMGTDIDGISSPENFGSSVALSNDGLTLVAAARNRFDGMGSVRLFKYIADEWVQQGSEIVGDSDMANFGYDVEINGAGNIFAASSILDDTNGENSGLSKVYSIDPISSIFENTLSQNITISPNPTGNIANLDFAENFSGTISVFNNLGQEIIRANEINGNRYTLSLNGLTEGIYLVKITSRDQSRVMKLIKK